MPHLIREVEGNMSLSMDLVLIMMWLNMEFPKNLYLDVSVLF